MSSSLYALLFACTLLAAVMLITAYKSGHFFKSILLSALSGTGALFAVNLLSDITGVSIPINYITLTGSGFFGIPGVIALLFMH